MNDTAPKLTSSEQYFLCSFILSTKEQREAELAAAVKDPKRSGALIQCMRWAMTL